MRIWEWGAVVRQHADDCDSHVGGMCDCYQELWQEPRMPLWQAVGAFAVAALLVYVALWLAGLTGGVYVHEVTL